MADARKDTLPGMVGERPWIGVGLFVLDRTGRFLMLRRRGAHGEGTWGLPGGKVEYGQSMREAASAEAFEEACLTIDPARIALGPHTSDVFHDIGRHYFTHYLSAALPDGQVPRIGEPHKCSEIGWFGFGDMPEPLFLPVANFLRQRARPPFADPA